MNPTSKRQLLEFFVFGAGLAASSAIETASAEMTELVTGLNITQEYLNSIYNTSPFLRAMLRSVDCKFARAYLVTQNGVQCHVVTRNRTTPNTNLATTNTYVRSGYVGAEPSSDSIAYIVPATRDSINVTIQTLVGSVKIGNQNAQPCSAGTPILLNSNQAGLVVIPQNNTDVYDIVLTNPNSDPSHSFRP